MAKYGSNPPWRAPPSLSRPQIPTTFYKHAMSVAVDVFQLEKTEAGNTDIQLCWRSPTRLAPSQRSCLIVIKLTHLPVDTKLFSPFFRGNVLLLISRSAMSMSSSIIGNQHNVGYRTHDGRYRVHGHWSRDTLLFLDYSCGQYSTTYTATIRPRATSDEKLRMRSPTKIGDAMAYGGLRTVAELLYCTTHSAMS